MIISADNNAVGGSGWKFVKGVSDTTQDNNLTISGLTANKKYHLFTTNSGSTAANALTSATLSLSSGASDFAVEDRVSAYAGSSSYYSALVHHSFKATATSASFVKSYNIRQIGYMLFEE